MEQLTIKEPFRFWAIRSRASDSSSRVLLLSGHEFHDDLDRVAECDSERQLAFISLLGKTALSVSASYTHSGTFGAALRIDGLSCSIELPCLVTDILNAQVIWNHEIELDTTTETRWIFEKDWDSRVYPVETKDWFGIVTRISGRRVHLIAFSEVSGASVSMEQLVRFTEWGDGLPMGKIMKC